MEWLLLAGLGGLVYFFAKVQPFSPAPTLSPVFTVAKDGAIAYTPAAHNSLAAMFQMAGWVALTDPQSLPPNASGFPLDLGAGQALIGPPALLQAQGGDVSKSQPAFDLLAMVAPKFDIYIASSAVVMMPAIVEITVKGRIPTNGPPVARSVAEASAGALLIRFSQAGDTI